MTAYPHEHGTGDRLLLSGAGSMQMTDLPLTGDDT